MSSRVSASAPVWGMGITPLSADGFRVLLTDTDGGGRLNSSGRGAPA
jgi:hypothetical protein